MSDQHPSATPAGEQPFVTLDPASLSLGALHHTMLSLVAPRPIAFAATLDEEGRPNLSPFSYFNVFGINPPTLVFAPARSVRTLMHKQTLLNARSVPECTISVVDRSIVEQASLASCEYPPGVSEFVKAGLTEAPSIRVRPPYVAESPAAFECRVEQIIDTGEGGGAGQLIICRVLAIHIQERYLTADRKVDIEKLSLVGRSGGNYYAKAYGDSLFQIIKPKQEVGVGFDALPEDLRFSPYLTGAQLSRLAILERLPNVPAERAAASGNKSYSSRDHEGNTAHTPHTREQIHRIVGQMLDEGRAEEAWLLYNELTISE